MTRIGLAASLALLSIVAGGCADGDAQADPLWTVQQAESIASVRGLPVRVRSCRGIGASEDERYRRFECLAGARTRFDRYDTVAVVYVVHPLDEYEGPASRHRLTRVQFIGGPGIP